MWYNTNAKQTLHLYGLNHNGHNIYALFLQLVSIISVAEWVMLL
jgi:hypothetical protein